MPPGGIRTFSVPIIRNGDTPRKIVGVKTLCRYCNWVVIDCNKLL